MWIKVSEGEYLNMDKFSGVSIVPGDHEDCDHVHLHYLTDDKHEDSILTFCSNNFSETDWMNFITSLTKFLGV